MRDGTPLLILAAVYLLIQIGSIVYVFTTCRRAK